MQPIRAVHLPLPPRPPTAPASTEHRLASGFRARANLSIDANALSLSSSVAALVTPARRGAPVTPLSDDVICASPGLDHYVVSTPTNSARRTSGGGGMSLMMPRSTRSLRHSVMEAREVTQQPMIAEPAQPRPATAPVVAAQFDVSKPIQRRAVPIAPLVVEVVGGAGVSQSCPTGLTTPMNVDRRDLNNSLQLNTPLWRGSALTQTSSHIAAPADLELSTTSTFVPFHTPKRRNSPAALNVEVANSSATSWIATPTGLATPMNMDRRDLSSSLQLNDPLWRGSGVVAYR